MIDLEKLTDLITPKTFLVSLMHANNETGVLHPIGEIDRKSTRLNSSHSR